MTEFVKQKDDYDCALCAFTMAAGNNYDAIREKLGPEFIADVQTRKGSYGEHLQRILEVNGFDYWKLIPLYVTDEIRRTKQWIWGRRAVLQVPSLNHEGRQHLVYWDGVRLYDPSNLNMYPDLDSVKAIAYVWLFDENN